MAIAIIISITIVVVVVVMVMVMVTVRSARLPTRYLSHAVHDWIYGRVLPPRVTKRASNCATYVLLCSR